ncbi:hypothetical protein ACFW04_006888 [Cataglyphis niger]
MCSTSFAFRVGLNTVSKINFPYCIEAIDGKHIELHSTFYNYKSTHSIVLLAVANTNCCFTIDIGVEGRCSDIF